MKRFSRFFVFFSILLPAFCPILSSLVHAGNTPASQDTVLKAADISPNLFPERVFFRGQVASAQLRNTGGVHFADGMYVLAGLVDNSGYSTDIRAKYQGYLLNEVTLEIGGQTLKPGAYGFGFLDGGKFNVMDLAANDLLQSASQRDAGMKRPVPLQVTASSATGAFRLYSGRDYVEFHHSH